ANIQKQAAVFRNGPCLPWSETIRKAAFALVLLLASIAGCWRLVHIERDPDIVTETSQDAWGDPNYYLYNARSHALLGDWRADEGLSMVVTPGYEVLASVVLSTFGVSFRNAVLLSIFSGF